MTETPQQDRVHTEHLRDYTELRRSVTDRKIAGVAGGLGRHLNIDPTILRVAFVVLCFFGGAGFVLYGAAWLLVPEEGHTEGQIATGASTRNALLIGAGVVAVVLMVSDSWGGFWFPWPLAVIALVVFAVMMNRDKPAATTGTAAYPDTQDDAPQAPVPPWMPPTQQAYQPPLPRPDRGPRLFWITLALVAIALGTLGLYDVSGGPVVAAAYPALALTVVGAMLVLGAWVGRAGGLILLGLVAAAALAVSSVASADFARERTVDVAPVSAASVQQHYSVPAGSVRLDLRDVADPQSLDGRTITLRARAGEIVVLLPSGVSARVLADVSGAGDVTLPGRNQSGTNIHLDELIGSADGTVPQVTLDLQVFVGTIEVRQS